MYIIIRVYVCIYVSLEIGIYGWIDPRLILRMIQYGDISYMYIYINLSAYIVINNLDTGLQNTYIIFFYTLAVFIVQKIDITVSY